VLVPTSLLPSWPFELTAAATDPGVSHIDFFRFSYRRRLGFALLIFKMKVVV